jgi:hypothetical protein
MCQHPRNLSSHAHQEITDITSASSALYLFAHRGMSRTNLSAVPLFTPCFSKESGSFSSWIKSRSSAFPSAAFRAFWKSAFRLVLKHPRLMPLAVLVECYITEAWKLKILGK